MRKAELAALAADAAEALSAEPSIATVIGERVRVLAVALEGNAWRGLVARVERRGEEHVVSLADVHVASGSPLHAVVERYRALLGVGQEREGPGEGGDESDGGATVRHLRVVSHGDAAPRDGRRASTRARELPIDLAELAIAMEDGEGDHAWYLDLETGAVFLVSDAIDDDDLPVPRDALDDDPRYVAVEPEEPGRAYRDLREFTATVKDRALRTRLEDALAGKGAFGRFKRVLAEDRGERERWFAFRDERLMARAREWLERIGVKVVRK